VTQDVLSQNLQFERDKSYQFTKLDCKEISLFFHFMKIYCFSTSVSEFVEGESWTAFVRC
jgi:hypothetical protein